MEPRKCYGPIHKGEEIDLALFALNQKVCRECKRAYDAARYEKKRLKIILRVQKYKSEHVQEVRDYNAAYRKEHPYKMPVHDRIWADLKRYVRKELSGYPFHFKSLEDLIGVSKQDLYTHLRSGFTRGMNEGNYGRSKLKWEIKNHFSRQMVDLRTCEGQISYFNYLNLYPDWHRKAPKEKAPFPNEKRAIEPSREERLDEAA